MEEDVEKNIIKLLLDCCRILENSILHLTVILHFVVTGKGTNKNIPLPAHSDLP